MKAETISNTLGIATLSLGSWKHHDLRHRLEEASRAGFQAVELFDEDWAAYLASQGQHAHDPWTPSEANLSIARDLGDLVNDLGMSIICVQPLRQIEGWLDPFQREQSLGRARERFPFMRALNTQLTFVCSHVHSNDENATNHFGVVVQHLRRLGEMAAAFAQEDGGPTIQIGYEGLAWGERNTWSSTWEIVRAVNMSNVGLVVDTFHWLAVEYADPCARSGDGLAYPSAEEAMDVLVSSITAFMATVPADKIFLVQLSDAELVNPKYIQTLQKAGMTMLQTWSRNCRLFPMEHKLGAYLPVELILAGIMAVGYTGPLSLEVFNESLHSPDDCVPSSHAQRGISSIAKVIGAAKHIPQFWEGRI
ncbi:xylose isomerase-like protein [Aspergillus aurantiobrunneus]